MNSIISRTILAAGLVFLSFTTFSQSIIKPKKGEEIKAQIISTEGALVEYKLYYFQEGASFTIAKSEIQYIKYPDGRMETFDPPAPSASPSTTPSYTAPSGDVTKALDKVAQQLKELKTGQDGQTKTLNETLNSLNTTLTSLKTTIEQGNKQTEETNTKLTTLNNAVKELNEKSDSKTAGENNAITPRKFGMGVSFITNYLLSNFSERGESDNPTINSNEVFYSGLLMGAGFNMIVSTRMDKKVGFRYEPEFNVASRFSSRKVGNDKSSIRLSLFSFGSRFLGVARRNRVNIYAGPSITILAIVLQAGENGTTTTGSYVGAGFGLHFGGEYLVHSNFGINMESGMQLYGLFPKGGSAEGIFSTYARLGGRFYF
ncbi:MAG: hypothetical protein KIS94_02300 [Chitinophagales bacterium]|nr:hypothetical protein [Chitinophagales bacterium]